MYKISNKKYFSKQFIFAQTCFNSKLFCVDSDNNCHIVDLKKQTISTLKKQPFIDSQFSVSCLSVSTKDDLQLAIAFEDSSIRICRFLPTNYNNFELDDSIQIKLDSKIEATSNDYKDQVLCLSWNSSNSLAILTNSTIKVHNFDKKQTEFIYHENGKDDEYKDIFNPLITIPRLCLSLCGRKIVLYIQNKLIVATLIDYDGLELAKVNIVNKWTVDKHLICHDFCYNSISENIVTLTSNDCILWSEDGIAIKQIKVQINSPSILLSSSLSEDIIILSLVKYNCYNVINSSNGSTITSNINNDIDSQSIIPSQDVAYANCELTKFNEFVYSSFDGSIGCTKYISQNSDTLIANCDYSINLAGSNKLELIQTNNRRNGYQPMLDYNIKKYIFQGKEDDGSIVSFQIHLNYLIIICYRRIHIYNCQSICDNISENTNYEDALITSVEQNLQYFIFDIIAVSFDKIAFTACQDNIYSSNSTVTMKIYDLSTNKYIYSSDIKAKASNNNILETLLNSSNTCLGKLKKLSCLRLNTLITTDNAKIVLVNILTNTNHVIYKHSCAIQFLDCGKQPQDEDKSLVVLCILDSENCIYLASLDFNHINFDLRKHSKDSNESLLTMKFVGSNYNSFCFNETLNMIACVKCYTFNKLSSVDLIIWPPNFTINNDYDTDGYNIVEHHLIDGQEDRKDNFKLDVVESVDKFQLDNLQVRLKTGQLFNFKIHDQVIKLHRAYESNSLDLYFESWYAYVLKLRSLHSNGTKQRTMDRLVELSIWATLGNMLHLIKSEKCYDCFRELDCVELALD